MKNVWQKLTHNEPCEFSEWCEWWARFYMSKKDFRAEVEKSLPELNQVERYKAVFNALKEKLLIIYYNPETKYFRLGT